MVYEITGKKYDSDVPMCSQDTVTMTIKAVDHNMAARKFWEMNPGYKIVLTKPIAL